MVEEDVAPFQRANSHWTQTEMHNEPRASYQGNLATNVWLVGVLVQRSLTRAFAPAVKVVDASKFAQLLLHGFLRQRALGLCSPSGGLAGVLTMTEQLLRCAAMLGRHSVCNGWRHRSSLAPCVVRTSRVSTLRASATLWLLLRRN